MKRRIVAVVAFLIAVAACGGDGSGGSAGGNATPTTGVEVAGKASNDESSSDATLADAGQGDDGEGDGGVDPGGASTSGIGTASIAIDGETYRFGETSFPALRCEPDTFGVFWVLLGMVDADGDEIPEGGSLEVVLLQDGTDSEEIGQLPMARLVLTALDQEWFADPEQLEVYPDLDPAISKVDDYTIDGNSASGTATFHERNSLFAFIGGTAEEITVAKGTFEATCADS